MWTATIMPSFLVFIVCNLVLQVTSKTVNDRPIIGVAAQETREKKGESAKSKIDAGYVKFIEGGGARVVPIWIGKPRKYYEDIVKKINGVLFPGGGADLGGEGYGRTGRIIFKLATKMNDEGDHFPLWGTCLGFELLNYIVANKRWMKACDAEDHLTKIPLVKDYKDSKMFHDLDSSLAKKMNKTDVAIHYHQWCITPENYTSSGLDKFFKVLAYDKDKRNMTFVSLVEAYKYPFYASSFHPEKVLFDWAMKKNVTKTPHTFDAIRVAQYMANFFVNEAKKSDHHFPNASAENEVLIYNYHPNFTGLHGTPDEMYYFDW